MNTKRFTLSVAIFVSLVGFFLFLRAMVLPTSPNQTIMPTQASTPLKTLTNTPMPTRTSISTQTATSAQTASPTKDIQFEWALNDRAYRLAENLGSDDSRNPYGCKTYKGFDSAIPSGVVESNDWGFISSSNMEEIELTIVSNVTGWRSPFFTWRDDKWSLPKEGDPRFFLRGNPHTPETIAVVGLYYDFNAPGDAYLAQVENDKVIGFDNDSYRSADHPVFGGFPGGYQGFISKLAEPPFGYNWNELQKQLKPLWDWRPHEEGYVTFDANTLQILDYGCRPH